MKSHPTVPHTGTSIDSRKRGPLPRLASTNVSSLTDPALAPLSWPCSLSEKSRLDQIHTEIGQTFLSDLESLLKQPLRLESTQLELPVYSRFVTNTDYPSLTVSAHDTSAQHHVAWHCPGVTTAYLLDALLGGGRYLPPPLQRTLTEIETGLLARLATRLWKHVETRWSAVTSMQLETQYLDSDGPRLRIAAANELMLSVTWTFSSQHVRTHMHLIYPWLEIQHMLRQLTPDSSATIHAPHVSAPSSLQPNACHSSVNVVLNWAHTTLTLQDLNQLGVGDLVVTDVPSDASVQVFCDGHFQHVARIIRQKDKLGLMIDGLRSPNDSP